MAMDKTRWGNAVAAAVKAVGVTAGTLVTDSQLQQIWQAVKNEDVIEISTNTDINLALNDISTNVPALGLVDSVPLACGGQATGKNQAVILTGKLE